MSHHITQAGRISYSLRSLDMFRLTDLSLSTSINLEESEQRQEAGSSKDALRIAPFWQWRSIHLSKVEPV